MNIVSDAKILGILCGVIVGLIIIPFALMAINKDRKIKTEYDERQELIRGRGFKFGFFSALIYTAILLLLSIFEIKIPATQPVIYFSIIFVAIGVWVVYCSLNGAYFGLNNDERRFHIFMFFISLINFAVPVRFIIDGSFIQDGTITGSGINLMCGMLFLIVGISELVKKHIDKKEGADDEES